MKPESIEARRTRRKKEAVQGVLLFALIQVLTAVAFLACLWIPDIPKWAALMFGGFALICMLVLIPALVVLGNRFKEIEGGELDEAGKY